jgi:EAL domain-containing protein (putative c-di-GMP-specific phosphodiesterase class I)/GGDEF domain-containing protein
MLAMVLLFGRHAVLPIIISFALVNEWNLNLPWTQAAVLLFCQVFSVLAVCAIVKWQVGSRWRYQLPSRYIWQRIFWLGCIIPLGIKSSMYLAGQLFHFPVALSSFFGDGSVIYNVVDIQSLICAALIFTMMFYYPLRMVINPRYARTIWIRSIKPYFSSKKQKFTAAWLLFLTINLLLLCLPFNSEFIAGYLVPVIFVLFTIGISRLSYPPIALAWAFSVLMLLTYNRNFLQGIQNGYTLAFVLSVLISFAICLICMSRIFQRNEWLKRGWQERALTDPLTGLPNLRALESYLDEYPDSSVCCLRMNNLEFLSRHYGLLMRVHCKRAVIREIQPCLVQNEHLYQLPGNELVLVLNGPETAGRLQYIIDRLNNCNIYWNNTRLDIDFSASWANVKESCGENLHHLLGQLSWLSEEACSSRQVLALTNSLDVVSDQTTDRVLMLNRVKRALDEDGLRLYAQPIHNAKGEGYYEILSRLESDGEIIMPDQFIPVVAQFNLSQRFDMSVLEALVKWLHAHPANDGRPRFSVNLMPLTLMQKEVAADIIALFKHYSVDPQTVIIEVTEEQAFSHSGSCINNFQQLRYFGFKIAFDDFGTGYANSELLKRLQADIVKIDGCFVKDICTDNMDAMIVQSICNLAKTRSLSVVAEFVETEEQREMLLSFGVDYLQGYLIGKPRPLTE